MNQKIPLLLAACLIGLTGCSTYSAKMEYQAEMEALCQKDGGFQIHKTVTLPGEFFKEGVLQYDNRPRGQPRTPLTLAGRFVFEKKSEVLKTFPEHRLLLRKNETTIIDKSTGETIATSRTYCRAGGDSISSTETIECCPSGKILATEVFKQEAK